MLYVSQLPPDQLIALEFESEQSCRHILHWLVKTKLDYDIASPTALIVPKAHQEQLATVAHDLGVAYQEFRVADPEDADPKERAQRRPKPIPRERRHIHLSEIGFTPQMIKAMERNFDRNVTRCTKKAYDVNARPLIGRSWKELSKAEKEMYINMARTIVKDYFSV